jgi:hypothetical protein
MAIPLGPGKKRPIQKGRNFVFTAKQQRFFDRVLKQKQKQRFKAQAIRTKSQAKEIAQYVLRELNLDLKSPQGQNKAAISRATRRRIHKKIVAKMPLNKEQKKFVSAVLERDSNLQHLEFKAQTGGEFNLKQVLDAFRQTLFDYKSLGSYGQQIIPNELANKLEFAVTNEKRISAMTLSPAFFSIARQINLVKLDKQFGKEITVFMLDTLTEISKQMAKLN